MIWRLIYDSENIITLFETTDITITQHNVYESSLIDNCFNKIDELGYNFEFVYNNQKQAWFFALQKTLSLACADVVVVMRR
jgi:hypothetical protein